MLCQLTRTVGSGSRTAAFVVSRAVSSRVPTSRAGRRVTDGRPGLTRRTAPRRPPAVEAASDAAAKAAPSVPQSDPLPTPAPPMPNAWVEVLDRDRGGVYYWNKATDETTELHAPPPEGFQLGAQSFDPYRTSTSFDKPIPASQQQLGSAADAAQAEANGGGAGKAERRTPGGETPESPPTGESESASEAWVEVLDRKRGGVYYWNKATHETTPLHAAPPPGFTPGAASLDPTRVPGQKGHPMYQAIGLAPPRRRPAAGELGQSEGSAAPQLGDGDRPAPLESAEGAAAGDHARPRPDKERSGGGLLNFFSGLSKRRDQGGSPEITGQDKRAANTNDTAGQKQGKLDEDAAAPISIIGALTKDMAAFMGKKGK